MYKAKLWIIMIAFHLLQEISSQFLQISDERCKIQFPFVRKSKVSNISGKVFATQEGNATGSILPHFFDASIIKGTYRQGFGFKKAKKLFSQFLAKTLTL